MNFACAEVHAKRAPRIARLELKRRYYALAGRSRPLWVTTIHAMMRTNSAIGASRAFGYVFGDTPPEASMTSSLFHWSNVGRSTNGREQCRIPCQTPVNVNHVLILSRPLPTYHGARHSLAKLFAANGRLVMGTSLGDKIVIVIALLLLAVVAVVSAEFPGIIRAARLVATL
jgi:hypothetical protein